MQNRFILFIYLSLLLTGITKLVPTFKQCCPFLLLATNRQTLQQNSKLLTIHTRGLVARRPGHLPRQTGALDCLGSLLDAVFVAASVGGDHLAGASLCGRQIMEQYIVSVALKEHLSHPKGLKTIGF